MNRIIIASNYHSYVSMQHRQKFMDCLTDEHHTLCIYSKYGCMHCPLGIPYRLIKSFIDEEIEKLVQITEANRYV